MKPPIWERQGRPKPPRIFDHGVFYSSIYGRPAVFGCTDAGTWIAEVRLVDHHFPTFAEAIAYADREARR